MKTSTLNKMSKEGREKIIELEGALRRLDEDMTEIDVVLRSIERNRGVLG